MLLAATMTTNRTDSSDETWIEVVDTTELANVTGGLVNPANVVRVVKAAKPVAAKVASAGFSHAGEMFQYIKRNAAAASYFNRPVEHHAIGTLLGGEARMDQGTLIRFGGGFL